jgi:hypothetical protein
MTPRAVIGAVLTAAALAACGVTTAAERLECTVEGHAGSPPTLELLARNAGDEPAREVRPEVTFQHRTSSGEAVTLAPGASHAWRLALTPPPAPGTFAATLRVRYLDGGAHRRSLPLVAQVPAADGSPALARMTLDVKPVDRAGGATLHIENPDARPLAGRVVFVLDDGLATDPESLAVEVAANGQSAVPLAIENRGALAPGSYPAYALFEYGDAAAHHAAVARTEVRVIGAGSARARPLLVGAGALAMTLALLAVAWRRAALRTRVAS